MKKIFLLFSMIYFLSSALFSQTITPIADIQDNLNQYLNQQVTIQGIITIGADKLVATRLQAYIQDESGKGLQIFHGSSNADYRRDIIRGNLLRVTGTIIEYQGVTEITSFNYEVLDMGYEVPVINLTVSQALNYQTWEGTFVKITGDLTEAPFYAGGGYNVNIRDAAGTSITVRVWDTTGINVSRLKAGVPIDAFGVVGIYNNRSQILPGYQEDIVIKITEPVIENILVNPERPFIDQQITVAATIIDFDGQIQSTKLKYRTGKQTEFSELNMNSLGGDNYSVIIPPYNSIESNEGEYIIKITAVDDDGNITNSPEKKITVTKRRPIISNIRFMNQPEAGDSLIVRADIADTDGHITEAKVLYSLNYSSSIREVQMYELGKNTQLFEAVLPGFSAGTMLNVSVWAIDDSLLYSIESLTSSGEEIRYVFPVKTTTASLKIKPKANNTFEGDSVEIGYFAKTGDKVIVRIYNSEGKLMATPINTIISTPDGINFYNWNGRDKNFRLVEPGLYICHLEVLDRVTGNKKTDKAPIVIGTRLK